MAATENGITNGVNGHVNGDHPAQWTRFSDIPPAIDVVLVEGGESEAVEVDLVDLVDDPTELCSLLENESVAQNYWMIVALAYAKVRKVDHAIEILQKGLQVIRSNTDKLSILTCLCWMHLWKCREAPRVRSDTQGLDVKTKDQHLTAATLTLNDASRMSPSYPPLFLARGVLLLLRASLQPPSKATAGPDNSERANTLRQAHQCFEDALRASRGTNIMAILGKARVSFSMGKYAEALQSYQAVLGQTPDLIDPDPRIGIGCCFWQLGHKDDAKMAWQRALELNPDSKIANVLLGLYNLHASSQHPTNTAEFANLYKKAMTHYTQKAFKLDERLPLTCATFGGFFVSRKAWPQAERLARRAIELTDVNAIASDGWYLLARKEHYESNYERAAEYYTKADQARGGEDRGYLPAKFGAAQIRVAMQDYDGAKFRLEKIVQTSKTPEVMTLLGTLYAEEVFAAQANATKEDKSTEMKKAISFLESVRVMWRDTKFKVVPDSSVLLNLARLYEIEHPDKSLQCLQQVEQMELDEIPDEDRPEDIEDEIALKTALREFLPPQLLNNMGCFHYQAEKLTQARELFQTALNACVKVGDKDSTVDTDALVTSISYNLARTYEAEGLFDEAKKVYEGLLERHRDYTDASVRLTYIALRQQPSDEGPKVMSKLIHDEPNNLEVRALYGWYLSKAKKRTQNIAEDQEQRHYKHTLQNYDKHDRYSLTGMGNIYLQLAREMRRETDQEKDKRRKQYEKAVEFFDKAIQLDPRNAYAAQGIIIAMIEDRKELSGAVQQFAKVKESVKDASVFINLGHLYSDLKQWSRAIENYEIALSKDRARDAQILACLGRVWLLKGKAEKNVQAVKTSLEYSQRALEVAQEQVHFKFNVGFVQFQLASLIYGLPETQRTLAEVEAASQGLDEAIQSFYEIAKSSNPPYPKGDIEQRANMGKNTMRKQLDRAMQSQKEFEEKNASRLQQARELRDAELKKRAEEKLKKEEEEADLRRKIGEERMRMQERDREMNERRAMESKQKEQDELTTDSETGEKRKRIKKKGGKRKKKGDDDIIDDRDVDDIDGEGATSRQRTDDGSLTPAASGDERPRKKKKRKLERKAKPSKYKSSELVVDSDDDENAPAAPVDDDDEDAAVTTKSRKAARVVDDEDEEEDDLFGDEGLASMADAPAAAVNGEGHEDEDE